MFFLTQFLLSFNSESGRKETIKICESIDFHNHTSNKKLKDGTIIYTHFYSFSKCNSTISWKLFDVKESVLKCVWLLAQSEKMLLKDGQWIGFLHAAVIFSFIIKSPRKIELLFIQNKAIKNTRNRKSKSVANWMEI